MSTLHQVILLFLLIQFVVVLVALIAATRMADPQLPISHRNPFRPASMRSVTRPRP